MGCGCGGSSRKTAQPAKRDGTPAKPTRERRQGGPGEEGYYWTGPKRSQKNPPADAA